MSESSQEITVIQIGNYGKNKIEGFPETYYKPMIDGKELNFIAETPDVAFLLGMQVKYLGANEQFAKYACRMLNIKTCWSE